MRPKAIYVITKATWGGATRYVWDLMSHAQAYSYEPVLVYGEEGILADRAQEAGIRVLRLPSLVRNPSPFQDLRTIKDLAQVFRNERPAVVHLNSSKAGFLGAVAARRAKVPKIIFTAHGWAFNEDRSRFSKALYTFLHFITVKLSHTTIAVSEAVAHDASAKVMTIKNGIAPFPLLAKEEARSALKALDPKLDTGGLWVGTIAELHKNKGLDIGIKGWREAKVDAQWVVIGGGEEEKELKASAPSSVHFLGFVPDAATYLSAFDLFLLPSRTEALGYVILEAGMAGVPVLASNVGGIREAVGDAPVGALFAPEDTHSLAEMLRASLRDPENLKRTGAALKSHVSKNFSLERMLTDTFALY